MSKVSRGNYRASEREKPLCLGSRPRCRPFRLSNRDLRYLRSRVLLAARLTFAPEAFTDRKRVSGLKYAPSRNFNGLQRFDTFSPFPCI